ncbi:MAG: DUF1786 domain-containing protein [Anaerolineales bacterium]|jgi:uncharacterized protein (DUF1786 family)
MQLLTVDIGTGTQDIYLFRSGMSPENGFKVTAPSPTMRLRTKIQEATSRGEDLLLSGVTMGGGPCHWAAEDHLRAGHKIYATPEAARTFNDDLDWVKQRMGIEIVSEEEAHELIQVHRIELRDFDYAAIASAFDSFGVQLEPAAIAVAVFDHGTAPPNVSDRQFRFDFLERNLRADSKLSAFAYLAADLPPSLTRMRAVAASAGNLDCPLVVMDTAPAAVLGATLDPHLASRDRLMACNLGNFHTLAFRLGPSGIEGVFEHHTGLVDLARLDDLLTAFANGTLRHQDVFEEHGHGALILHPEPLPLETGPFGVAVTGPRRSMMQRSRLRPYFAVPYGDMMLTGCFGLLAASADLLPNLAEPIHQALAGADSDIAPWDAQA